MGARAWLARTRRPRARRSRSKPCSRAAGSAPREECRQECRHGKFGNLLHKGKDMRLSVVLFAACAYAQAPFSVDQVISAPFPSDLTASAAGKIAWVSNARGVRNIRIAEPPEYRARAMTAY